MKMDTLSTNTPYPIAGQITTAKSLQSTARRKKRQLYLQIYRFVRAPHTKDTLFAACQKILRVNCPVFSLIFDLRVVD